MHAFRARFHLASKLVPVLAQAGKVIQGDCALELFTRVCLAGLSVSLRIDCPLHPSAHQMEGEIAGLSSLEAAREG